MGNDPMKALGVFVGSWRTTGTIDAGAGEEPVILAASDVYEWFPGNGFILHRVDGAMGESPVKALEVMRHDEQLGLISHAFDNGGRCTEYRLELDNRNWRIQGSSERFEGQFNKDFTVLEGQWFLKKDHEAEKPWMVIRLEKVID